MTLRPILAALAIVASFSAPALSQDMKIGIVDMNRVFGEYEKTKEAEKRVNEDKSSAKKELDERAARYRELMQKWNDKQKMINDKLLNEELRRQSTQEANEISSELKSLERDMEEFRRRREQQLQEQVSRMRKGLLEDIKVRVVEKAKRDNYDIVFDKSGKSPIGVNFLLYSQKAIDFTDDVLGELNKDGGGAATPKEENK
jgi:Skp family chaperone for outer membrane proteins